MNVVGIIVEYNPLHNGHAYHVTSAKETAGADACVAVMSGHFLQRGEPAVVNKWARTQMALHAGVDLVIELPVPYATQHSEQFARGAVSALHQLGEVDSLCFGSESGRIEDFAYLVDILHDESTDFQQSLQHYLRRGWSYPKSYAGALEVVMRDQDTGSIDIQQPNNILGLEYMAALKRWNSAIRPCTIKRTKAGYHDERIRDRKIASATAIRKILFESGDLPSLKPYVPQSTYEILADEFTYGRGPMDWNRFFPYLQYALFRTSITELGDIYDVHEGLENRIQNKILGAENMTQFLHDIKTKRYTWNRIQRILLNTLLRMTKPRMHAFRFNDGLPYLRVLGFNSTGRELLNEAKKKVSVPLITNVPKERPAMLNLDIQATMIYALGYDPTVQQQEIRREFIQPPITL